MTEGDSSHHKVWYTAAAVSTAVLLLLMRQRRAKRQAARQSAANATRAALQKAAQRSLLPIFVRPESLPTGWGVAPPVFYPPHCAVIPLVLPCEMEEIERSSHLVRKVSVATASGNGTGDEASEGPSAFILCTYTGAVVAVGGEDDIDDGNGAAAAAAPRKQLQRVLADLLSRHPILQEQFGSLATQWTPLALPLEQTKSLNAAGSATVDAAACTANAGADAVTSVFTHILQGADNCVLLGGVSGPYFVVAVLSGFAGTWAAGGAATATTEPGSATRTPKSSESQRALAGSGAAGSDAVMDLTGVVAGVARAAFRVPLSASKAGSAEARLPGGSAFAVHRGFYRVLCVRDGRELELCIPTELTVRSELVNLSLVTPHGSPVVRRVSSGPLVDENNSNAEDALITLTFTPSPFCVEDAVEVRVSEKVFAALAEEPQETAAVLWEASGAAADAHPAAAAAFRAVTARLLAASSHGRANMVTMVYVQPQLGVLFSVHPLSTVVYEPWMTQLPTILYYPLGEGDAADEVAPPHLSIEYVAELPATWEVLKKDEEELRHNVLFHFTNWEVATVTASMVEISGIRCVMFHEELGGRRCRSYVLPRGSTVLVVRWETAAESWEKHLPVFQQTLDTLHVDATPITK